MEHRWGKGCCRWAWSSAPCGHNHLPSRDLGVSCSESDRTSRSQWFDPQSGKCGFQHPVGSSPRWQQMFRRGKKQHQQCRACRVTQCCGPKCKHMNQHRTLRLCQRKEFGQPSVHWRRRSRVLWHKSIAVAVRFHCIMLGLIQFFFRQLLIFEQRDRQQRSL